MPGRRLVNLEARQSVRLDQVIHRQRRLPTTRHGRHSEAQHARDARQGLEMIGTGTFRRDRGGYRSNLVVVAKPIGLAR